MFTMVQTIDIARDIQASHRQRAAKWRFHHRGREQAEVIPPTAPEPVLGAVVVLRQRVPATSALDVA